MTTRPPYQLPNGLSVRHLNGHETDFLYKEIFEDEVYWRHGMYLKETACVFDVGANIGLFTLFALQRCPTARVVAFEPSLDAYECLKKNTASYGENVKTYRSGLSDENREAVLTFYPNNSILSGFYDNEAEQKRFLAGYITNYLIQNTRNGREPFPWYVESLVTELLQNRRQETCCLRTMSSIISELGITKIDLLKIDAERCEADIVRGINEEHWGIIERVAMEIHETEDFNAGDMCALLQSKGFRVEMAEQRKEEEVGICNLHATRSPSKS